MVCPLTLALGTGGDGVEALGMLDVGLESLGLAQPSVAQRRGRPRALVQTLDRSPTPGAYYA